MEEGKPIQSPLFLLGLQNQKVLVPYQDGTDILSFSISDGKRHDDKCLNQCHPSSAHDRKKENLFLRNLSLLSY